MIAARRVLVVEDDPVSRLVLAHMLTRLGHQVVVAEEVGVARQLAGAGVDLVLADFWLLGGTGLDLLAGLRADHVLAPFVLITGAVEVAGPDGLAARAPGVAARLTKPLDSRGLATCLATAFA